MRKWSKVAVPLGIAAVIVSALVFGGFRVPASDAAQCAGGSTGFTGKVSSTVTYQFEFCSDPTLNLAVFLQWGNGKKDLALVVTEPNGTQHVVDTHGQFYEGYGQGAPLPEGTWTVQVVNHSPGPVSYNLGISLY